MRQNLNHILVVVAMLFALSITMIWSYGPWWAFLLYFAMGSLYAAKLAALEPKATLKSTTESLGFMAMFTVWWFPFEIQQLISGYRVTMLTEQEEAEKAYEAG